VFVALACVASMLGGCSSPDPAKTAAELDAMDQARLPGTILDVRGARVVSIDEMMDGIGETRLVFAGEQHDNPAHHEVQRKVLEEMWKRNARVCVGMEMFQKPYQKFLDDYIAKKISEVEMLKGTEYFTRWGFDYEFYRPVIEFAREKGLKVVALNVPGEINRKVARGGLASLTPQERASLPEVIDTTDAAHMEYVRSVYDGQGPMKGMLKFENFYEAQCVWEDGMADSAAAYLKGCGDDGMRMLVCIGRGHTEYGFGVPKRAAKRLGAEYCSIIPEELDDKEKPDFKGILGSDVGHFVWFTKARPMAPKPKLGVDLDATAKGVRIKSVAKGGTADKAGILAGDVLLSLDGTDIKDVGDLRIVLGLRKAGDACKVAVMRDGKRLDLDVELQAPAE
jgi:aminopeptidase N